MSLKWAGVPELCPHGNYGGKDCDKCELTRLRGLLQECVPYIEAAMPEISSGPFPGPDAQLDCDDMDLSVMCDLYHRVKREVSP